MLDIIVSRGILLGRRGEGWLTSKLEELPLGIFAHDRGTSRVYVLVLVLHLSRLKRDGRGGGRRGQGEHDAAELHLVLLKNRIGIPLGVCCWFANKDSDRDRLR